MRPISLLQVSQTMACFHSQFEPHGVNAACNMDRYHFLRCQFLESKPGKSSNIVTYRDLKKKKVPLKEKPVHRASAQPDRKRTKTKHFCQMHSKTNVLH